MNSGENGSSLTKRAESLNYHGCFLLQPYKLRLAVFITSYLSIVSEDFLMFPYETNHCLGLSLIVS